MRDLYLKFVTSFLEPLARICVRHSLQIQDVIECLKRSLLRAAHERLSSDGAKITISRLSVMTGIHRKDIDRLSSGAAMPASAESLLVKVIGAWQHNYSTKSGKPRLLSNSDFQEVVRSVSKELNPATVLFELERAKVIKVDGDTVQLILDAYAPSDKVEYGLKLLAEDVSDISAAVSENLDAVNDIPNLHARTFFDNVRPEHLPELRSWLLREGHKFHLEARKFLSKFDQDLNPEQSFKGKGVKVVLGTFSHISAPNTSEEEQKKREKD